MVPLIFNLGPSELLIILAIVLLLFGGSRLAGLGKSTGRALKEFKEETKGLKAGETPPAGQNPYETGGGSTVVPSPPSGTPYAQPQQNPSGQAPQNGVPPTGSPYGSAPQADGSYVPPQPGTTEHDVRRDV